MLIKPDAICCDDLCTFISQFESIAAIIKALLIGQVLKAVANVDKIVVILSSYGDY